MNKLLRKSELLEQIQIERGKLEETIAALSRTQMAQPGVTDAGWSVKDVVAHLADWEERFVSWYRAGLRGQVPKLPAPGISWNQVSLLNQQIFEKHRRRSLDDVLAEFRFSYRQVLKTVQEIPDSDLTWAGRYAWTGKSTVGDLAAASTCDHYRWAREVIRKWAKVQKLETLRK